MIDKPATMLVKVTKDQQVVHPLYDFGVRRNIKAGDLIVLDGGWKEDPKSCYYQTSYGRFPVLAADLDKVENPAQVMLGKTIAILHHFMRELDAVGRPFVAGQKHLVKTFQIGPHSYDVAFNGSSSIIFYIIGIFPDEMTCTCTSRLLFQSGCRCGFLKK